MARLYSNYMFSRAPFSGAQGFFGARDGGERLAGLKQSLGYRQTDWRGRQRMEQMESMGLPFNTDPKQVKSEPLMTYAMGGRPIYSTSMPLPWGTWGGVGGGEERPVKLKEPIGIPSQREQPSKEAPEGYTRSRYGYLEKDYSKEGYEKDRYGYWQKKDIPKFPSK